MLDIYYDKILSALRKYPDSQELNWREFAGQRFLYVKSSAQVQTLMERLLGEGQMTIAGTRLSLDCQYVRSQGDVHVFRYRLLVPNEKMFCCANGCPDCTLYRDRTF
ncbi:hypothetical protein [Brevibacillus dissolubilis]|uniref:hypothetical protein n=1 Tax=Brevibacillus dissolubilis TaxID=1844116 RepID=UPI00111746CC|nr:hypothetical protein [Brevibacillus dissolubilis]